MIGLVSWVVVTTLLSGGSARRKVVGTESEAMLARTIARYEARAKAERVARAGESMAAYEKLLKHVRKGRATMVSIMDHGAYGDGVHDDAPALLRSVAAAVEKALELREKRERVVVHLPEKRTYLLATPVVLQSLKGSVELRIDGTVLAPGMDTFPKPLSGDERRLVSGGGGAPPNSMSPELRRMQYAFIEVVGADGLRITGSGAIEGDGKQWWRLRRREPKRRAPVLLLIRDSANVAVSHLELRNSPFYHVVVLRSRGVELARLNISSPSNSVNTDGIDVLASSLVAVVDCWVSTGDDNVAIKERSTLVTVRGGTFHRGHGLSIGSLGEGGTTSSVTHVHLADVTFVRTTNAARIKTWQGGRGYVMNVTFANLSVEGVGTPIVVDQFYCPVSQHPEPCRNSTSAVAVSDVTIDGISGWHTSGLAAMLHCSAAVPCSVTLRNLHVLPSPGCSNVVRCLNVRAVDSHPRLGEYNPMTRSRWRTRRHLSFSSPVGGGDGQTHGHRRDLPPLVPCANGKNEMHGFRLDISRKEQRNLLRNFSCVHPP